MPARVANDTSGKTSGFCAGKSEIHSAVPRAHTRPTIPMLGKNDWSRQVRMKSLRARSSTCHQTESLIRCLSSAGSQAIPASQPANLQTTSKADRRPTDKSPYAINVRYMANSRSESGIRCLLPGVASGALICSPLLAWNSSVALTFSFTVRRQRSHFDYLSF